MTDLITIVGEKKQNFAKFLEGIHLPESKHRLLDDYIKQIKSSTPELFSYYIKEKIVNFHKENCTANLEKYVLAKLDEVGIKKEELQDEEFQRFVKYLELFMYILE